LPNYFFLFLFLFCFSTLYGQVAFPEVVAKEGDGVITLLRRNGLDPSVHFHSFLKLNQKLIGKGNTLYAGKRYRLPVEAANPAIGRGKPAVPAPPAGGAPKAVAPNVLVYPLLGKKYARVEVRNQQLKEAVYYLSAGHGGPDPGAIGRYGSHSLAEDEYAYDVTIRLARRLMEHGATVYMIVQDPKDGIRDEAVLKMDREEVCYPNLRIPLSQKERLRQRTAAVNNLHRQHKGAYQRMLAIHIDSRSQSQNIDVFFYHHENSSAGQRLAETIHKTFTSKYSRHQPNRDYFGSVSPRSSLYVVKYSHPPAVFIELGNIRNDLDQRRFVIPDNRQALANWICEGIISDYKSR
jgi:N-acetylmuramoyl-L-alanine amidase